MANVTWAPRRGVTAGAVAFDTGPGVAVIDAVTRRIDSVARFDERGERARRGKACRSVLDALLADSYFAAPPPKSTGRERFGPDAAARLVEDVRRGGTQSAPRGAPERPGSPAASRPVRWAVLRRGGKGGARLRVSRFPHRSRYAGQPPAGDRRARPARPRPHHAGVTASLARLVFPS